MSRHPPRSPLRRAAAAILRFIRGLIVMMIGAAMIAVALGFFIITISMAFSKVETQGQGATSLCVAVFAFGGLYTIRLGYYIMLG